VPSTTVVDGAPWALRIRTLTSLGRKSCCAATPSKGHWGEHMQRQDDGKRACAYCGRQRGMFSREHLMPAALTGRVSEPLIANVRTSRGEVAITGEPTIKDVCTACNNGPLSMLDEYAVKLYDKYFHRIVETGDLVAFEYDFDLLARWLLKIVYNYARARNWEFNPSRELLDYVLTGAPLRTQPEVILQLIVPTKERPGVHGRIDPIDSRVGLLVPNLLLGPQFGALVAQRSYYFYLLLVAPETRRSVRERILEKLRKQVPGAVRLSGKNRAKVYASFQDFASHAFHSPALIRNFMLKRPKGLEPKSWAGDESKGRGR